MKVVHYSWKAIMAQRLGLGTRKRTLSGPAPLRAHVSGKDYFVSFTFHTFQEYSSPIFEAFSVEALQSVDGVVVDVRHKARLDVKICVVSCVRPAEVRQPIELGRNSRNFEQSSGPEVLLVFPVDDGRRFETRESRQHVALFGGDDDNVDLPAGHFRRFIRCRCVGVVVWRNFCVDGLWRHRVVDAVDVIFAPTKFWRFLKAGSEVQTKLNCPRDVAGTRPDSMDVVLGQTSK